MGCSGKTKLAKYLAFKGRALYVDNGEVRDIYHGWAKHKGYEILCFDLPKSFNSEKEINSVFHAIEGIKNGIVYSSKYDSEQIICDPAHVLVFSNKLYPKGHMSVDRWQPYRMHEGKKIKSMSHREYQDFLIDYWDFEREVLAYRAASKTSRKEKEKEEEFTERGKSGVYTPSTFLLEEYGY